MATHTLTRATTPLVLALLLALVVMVVVIRFCSASQAAAHNRTHE
jgi:hypothetical protein